MSSVFRKSFKYWNLSDWYSINVLGSLRNQKEKAISIQSVGELNLIDGVWQGENLWNLWKSLNIHSLIPVEHIKAD